MMATCRAVHTTGLPLDAIARGSPPRVLATRMDGPEDANKVCRFQLVKRSRWLLVSGWLQRCRAVNAYGIELVYRCPTIQSGVIVLPDTHRASNNIQNRCRVQWCCTKLGWSGSLVYIALQWIVLLGAQYNLNSQASIGDALHEHIASVSLARQKRSQSTAHGTLAMANQRTNVPPGHLQGFCYMVSSRFLYHHFQRLYCLSISIWAVSFCETWN